MAGFSLSAQQQSSQRQKLEEQRKALSTEIAGINQLLNENKKSISSVLSNLNLILQKITAQKKLIAVLEKEIRVLDEEIRLKESQIKKLDQELQQKKDNYALSIQKMHQQKNNQRLLFVLSADNPAQSFRRMLYLKEYAGWRKQQADEIIVEQQQINIEKEALLADKQKKEELSNTRKKEESHLHQAEANNKIQIDDLRKNAKKLQAEMDKKKKQAAALDREISKIIAEEIAKANKAAKTEPNVERKAETKGGLSMTKEEQALSSVFAENKGKLPFPLAGRYAIAGRFGAQQYGNLKGTVYDSPGIKIKTTVDNHAKAVFDGEVLSIFFKTEALYTIIIKHGNYFTIYSGLEEFLVKQGDKVKTGQNIGKIYTDRGGTEDTILYFELRKDQEVQNPELWLNK